MLTNTLDLYKAVKLNDFPTIKQLLDDPNIDINMSNDQGDTPLILAVGSGNLQILNLLLTRPKLDFHAQSLVYGTALTYAIYKKEWEAANQLLEKEILNFGKFADENHPAALIWAVRNDNIELVKTLHQYGANINSWDDYDSEPPQYIANEIFRSKIATPFQGNPSNPTFNLPLIFAVRNQSYEMISLLIQLGADPNLKGLRDQSAFDALKFLKDSEKAKKVELILTNKIKIDNTKHDDTKNLVAPTEKLLESSSLFDYSEKNPRNLNSESLVSKSLEVAAEMPAKNHTSCLVFAHKGSDESAVKETSTEELAKIILNKLKTNEPELFNKVQKQPECLNAAAEKLRALCALENALNL